MRNVSAIGVWAFSTCFSSAGSVIQSFFLSLFEILLKTERFYSWEGLILSLTQKSVITEISERTNIRKILTFSGRIATRRVHILKSTWNKARYIANITYFSIALNPSFRCLQFTIWKLFCADTMREASFWGMFQTYTKCKAYSLSICKGYYKPDPHLHECVRQ